MLSLILAGCSTLDGMADRFGLGTRAPSGEDPVGAPADPFYPSPDLTSDPALDPATAAPPPSPTAQTAVALDTTTPAQRAAASAPVATTTALGKTVASLGSPSEPGLWLKTPLVKMEQQGRVTNPANGKSSLVTLIPIDGPATGGSRMSLSAMRLIGASLTDLTEVTVSLDG